MAGQRKYHDACAVAHALDILGERWALLVVRELLLGPKRFSDLRAGLPSVSTDMLTTRLRELESHGVVRRHKLPAPASSWVYELTTWGSQLEPIVVSLAQWSSQSAGLADRANEPLSVDSAALALHTLFKPDADPRVAATVELRLNGQPFRVNVTHGALSVERGEAPDAEISITTDPAALTALLTGTSSLNAERKGGRTNLHGDPAAAQRFLDLFGTPTHDTATP
ncbi:winged helix-turn-helix transcriptional regulator [Plantactinospora sp. B24E8]|uniref:winged helix-turn-helix transcriptional regulator n=1 Tax=Plantactinospora sp. B24E8 TaxID=3153567 RepID=UPI00325CA58C